MGLFSLFPLSLAQRPLSNGLVHRFVDSKHSLAESAQRRNNARRHHTVRPVRNRGIGVGKNTIATDLTERSAHEALWVWNSHGRTADLRHGRGNEVADNKLDVDAVRSKFAGKSSGPVLQESLAAGVGGQKRSGQEAGERAHRENQSALTLHHTGDDELSNAQSTEAVDCDDVLHFFFGGQSERHRDAVAKSNIVDQDRNIHSLNQRLEIVVVGIVVHRKVHRKRLRLNIGLAFDFSGDSSQFLRITGDEDDIVSRTSELECILLANSISRASDESPAALGTEGAQLQEQTSQF